MFLHIQTFGKQISLHSMEAVEEDEDVEAKAAEPLNEVIKSALGYWKLSERYPVVLNQDGDRLDLTKSAKDNGLEENDLVIVTNQKLLDKEKENVPKAGSKRGKNKSGANK